MSDEATGNAQILVLLSQHITDTQLARAEATKNIADLSGTVKTVVNEMSLLRQRIERVERDREATHVIAVGARNSSADLQAAVQVHVAASEKSIGAQFEKQNKVLEKQDAVLDEQTKELEHQGTQLTGLLTFQTGFEASMATIKVLASASPFVAGFFYWLLTHLAK